jgi:hypothetical protein
MLSEMKNNVCLVMGGIPLKLAAEVPLREACTAAGMAGLIKCTIRVRRHNQNGSWAMLDFADTAAMKAAANISIITDSDDGDRVFLQAQPPSETQKLGVSAWVGNIPLKYANEQALRTVLLQQGIDVSAVKKCTIRVKAEKENGSWALLTFADGKIPEEFLAKQVQLPGDTDGIPVLLRMQAFHGEKMTTGVANALVITHVMQVQGQVASPLGLEADTNDLVPQLPPGKRYHFFLCHHQSSGGDQCSMLCHGLKQLGFQVWYDNDQQAIHRNLQGMQDGVISWHNGRNRFERSQGPGVGAGKRRCKRRQ